MPSEKTLTAVRGEKLGVSGKLFFSNFIKKKITTVVP